MSDPIYTLCYQGMAVVAISPGTVKRTGCICVSGTMDTLNADIASLDLTPLPDPALVAAKTAKLKALAAALNASLTAAFKTAPIQAQVVFSNITSPIADLVSAGQLVSAIAALNGMLADDLVPNKYSPIIQGAVNLITAQEASFAAVAAAATVAQVTAIGAPAAPATTTPAS